MDDVDFDFDWFADIYADDDYQDLARFDDRWDDDDRAYHAEVESFNFDLHDDPWTEVPTGIGTRFEPIVFDDYTGLPIDDGTLIDW